MDTPASQTGMSSEPTHMFTYNDVDVGRILGDLEGDASFLSKHSIANLKRNFEFESKRSWTLELHLIILSEYYKNGRIPRGMRSQLRPNLFVNDNDFKLKFEHISNKYALDLILLNIEYLKRELINIRTKARDLDALLKSNLPEDEYTTYCSKQQDFLNKVKGDLEETRRRKWHRDLTDYEQGRVYNWNSRPQPFNNQWTKRPPMRQQEEQDAATSSPAFLGVRPDRKESIDLLEEGAEGGVGTIRKTRNQRPSRTVTPRTLRKK